MLINFFVHYEIGGKNKSIYFEAQSSLIINGKRGIQALSTYTV